MAIPPIIDVNELLKIHNKANTLLFDVSNHKNAYTNFLNEHLEGTQFVDMNLLLAEIPENAANGGRHPLPAIKSFIQNLSKLGIENNSHVILYDDSNGANAAARFWWMLKSIGHKKVQVLNGGLKAAKLAYFPLSKRQNKIMHEPTIYEAPKNWQLPLAKIEEVEKATCNRESLIIDVRASERYAGLVEPLDTVAGHIPTAINIPYTENLTHEGFFKKPDILKNHYHKILSNFQTQNIIVHCGSGVTACHTLLALDYAGIKIPNLYVGSWSEWSRNQKPNEK